MKLVSRICSFPTGKSVDSSLKKQAALSISAIIYNFRPFIKVSVRFLSSPSVIPIFQLVVDHYSLVFSDPRVKDSRWIRKSRRDAKR